MTCRSELTYGYLRNNQRGRISVGLDDFADCVGLGAGAARAFRCMSRGWFVNTRSCSFEGARLRLSQPDASARDCDFDFLQCFGKSLADASGWDKSLLFRPFVLRSLGSSNRQNCGFGVRFIGSLWRPSRRLQQNSIQTRAIPTNGLSASGGSGIIRVSIFPARAARRADCGSRFAWVRGGSSCLSGTCVSQIVAHAGRWSFLWSL
jgi:hypothetical protein